MKSRVQKSKVRKSKVRKSKVRKSKVRKSKVRRKRSFGGMLGKSKSKIALDKIKSLVKELSNTTGELNSKPNLPCEKKLEILAGAVSDFVTNYMDATKQ